MNRLLLPLLVAALAVPAAAQASEPVGVDPDSVYGAHPQTCDDGCTLVQDVNANLAVRVPTLPGGRGVITSWKIRGGGGSARLRRARRRHRPRRDRLGHAHRRHPDGGGLVPGAQR